MEVARTGVFGKSLCLVCGSPVARCESGRTEGSNTRDIFQLRLPAMSPIAIPVEDDHSYVNPSGSQDICAHPMLIPSPSEYRDKPIEIITNEGHLSPDQVGWLRSFPADTPDEVLRDELNSKGVVHVKNVMPRDYVLGVRRRWV